MKITEFTVSHNFETYRGGSKASQFVSAKVVPDEPISLEDFPVAHLRAKLSVGKACIMGAMASGDITVEDAKERADRLKENIESIEKARDRKYPPAKKIIVNGRPDVCIVDHISYEEIILAAEYKAGRILTVVYRHADQTPPDGSLTPGQSVKIKDGTIFSVADTSNA
jgi:hypothetical protein